MNPTIETRYALVRYVVLWTFFAAVWAAAFGLSAGLAAGVAAVGGAAFGTMGGLAGMLLWNVLKYGTDGIAIPFMRFVFRTAVGAMFTAVTVGAEVAAVWLSMERLPAEFVATIPARILCVVSVYAFFALWYSYAARADETEAELTDAGKAEDAAGNSKPVPARTGEHIERITVRGGSGKIDVIGVDNIAYLQAEGDYVAIVTTSGRWLKEGTMKYFEDALPRGKFVRIHRSYIVSVSHISRIEASGRERSVVLRGGVVIRISDTGYKLLRRTLGL